MKSTFFLLTFLGILVIIPGILEAQDTTQQINTQSRNQQEQISKPYVILISADGFRADMAEKFGASHLLRLSKQGVKAHHL